MATLGISECLALYGSVFFCNFCQNGVNFHCCYGFWCALNCHIFHKIVYLKYFFEEAVIMRFEMWKVWMKNSFLLCSPFLRVSFDTWNFHYTLIIDRKHFLTSIALTHTVKSLFRRNYCKQFLDEFQFCK